MSYVTDQLAWQERVKMEHGSSDHHGSQFIPTNFFKKSILSDYQLSGLMSPQHQRGGLFTSNKPRPLLSNRGGEMYTYAPLSAQHGRPQSAYHQRNKKSSGARNFEIVTTPKNNGYWKSNAIHGPVKVAQTPDNEVGGGINRRMNSTQQTPARNNVEQHVMHKIEDGVTRLKQAEAHTHRQSYQTLLSPQRQYAPKAVIQKQIEEQGLMSPKVRKIQRVRLAKDPKKAYESMDFSPMKKKLTGIPFDRFNEELTTIADPVGGKADSSMSKMTTTLSQKSNRRFVALNAAPSLTKRDLDQLSVIDKNEVIKAIREGDDFQSQISMRSINDGLNALRSTRIQSAKKRTVSRPKQPKVDLKSPTKERPSSPKLKRLKAKILEKLNSINDEKALQKLTDSIFKVTDEEERHRAAELALYDANELIQEASLENSEEEEQAAGHTDEEQGVDGQNLNNSFDRHDQEATIVKAKKKKRSKKKKLAQEEVEHDLMSVMSIKSLHHRRSRAHLGESQSQLKATLNRNLNNSSSQQFQTDVEKQLQQERRARAALEKEVEALKRKSYIAEDEKLFDKIQTIQQYHEARIIAKDTLYMIRKQEPWNIR